MTGPAPRSDSPRPAADPAPRPPEARERILHAAARLLAAGGAAQMNLQDVAREAGVSKGLIHYHFTDKDALLARVAAWMGEQVVARERRALSSSTPHTAIDALWRWLEEELERGELRALQELARHPAPAVADAALEIAVHRREAAAVTVEELFAALGLHARLPVVMLGEVVLAFTDGLAARPGRQRGEARAAFDVFWLALLGLAE